MIIYFVNKAILFEIQVEMYILCNYTKTWSGSFLNVSCNMESETILSEVFVVKLKVICFVSFWMILLPIYDFVASNFGHLENTDSVS